MARDGKSKYQLAVERAQSRGFSSPYAERKAQAQKRGFTSPRTERTARARARGVERDYAMERERANIRARGAGFLNSRERAKFNKSGATDKTLFQKQRTLDYFGISESTLKRIRTANRRWSKEYAELQWTAINTYDRALDADITNWSPNRIGYIIAFHAAIVNPKTNYESLLRKVDGKQYGERQYKNGYKTTNRAQFYYLVEYTNLMQVDEFEARYGRNIVQDAIKGKPKP